MNNVEMKLKILFSELLHYISNFLINLQHSAILLHLYELFDSV